jgi:hypothetical protein
LKRETSLVVIPSGARADVGRRARANGDNGR